MRSFSGVIAFLAILVVRVAAVNVFERAGGGGVSCPAGQYYNGNNCQQCQAGYACPGGTSQPSQCQKGTYASARALECAACPPGTYTDQNGASSCTPAQCGWYAKGGGGGSGKGADKQDKCGKGSYSAAGSSSCTKCPAGSYCNSDTTCKPTECQPMNQSTCPTSGPEPSGLSRKRSIPRGCALKSHARCEVKTGRGGWECVDTNTTLDACGSCDNDCSVIPYVGDVKCMKGKCQVSSCQKGFALQILDSRPSCIPTTKHAYMIFEADTGLMSQS